METHRRILDEKVRVVQDDPEFKRLLREMTIVTRVDWRSQSEQTVFLLLQSYHFPLGECSKFVRIRPKDVAAYDDYSTFILKEKVGSTKGLVHQALRELAARASHIEIFSGESICVFLGKMFDPKNSKTFNRYRLDQAGYF